MQQETIIDKIRRRVSQRRSNVTEKVYFLHIPKCGGSSLNRGLTDLFAASEHLNPGASRQAAEALGVDLTAHREQLLLYFMAQDYLRYIAGHFSWSNAAYERYGDAWRYITVLRHPVDKWFSEYYYNRHKASPHGKVEVDLETFLASEQGRLLGRDCVDRLSQASLDKAVAQAKENLEKFSVVGILERFDLFQRDFEGAFGAALRIPHTNKNPADKQRKEAARDPEIRRQVEALCEPDLELYDYALSRK